ncbi:MAG: polysaccharide biosynthesis tyrosine autokinase [Clostridiales bacterium]|nr:polysaccharide biosynthesis tyrosine autokinase [Clostridiales bacterium]
MGNYNNGIKTVKNAGAKPTEPEVNIEVIFFNIIRHWWIILIGCIIAAMVAYIVILERYVPKYHTEATFVVSSKDGGSDQVYSNLVVASKIANSLTYVLESPVLQQKVAESLELKKFDGEITAKIIENTNLIQVSIEASSPQLAFDEMNGIIEQHHAVSDNVLGSVVLDVLKAPTVPTEPVRNIQLVKKVLISTGVAAVLIMSILVMHSLVSDEIMTETDLETKVDCRPLATIYHERKNLSLRARLRGMKTSMLITNPTTSFRFAETYRLFRTRLEHILRQKDYKVIMFSSVLENEGKTTTAANTAITLALNNHRVLLMDCDMLKPALYKALGARVRRGKAVNEFIEGDGAMESIPKMDGLPTLSLLMGKNELSNSTEVLGSREMKEFIKRAREYFDYVVIDTPPISIATDAECAAELADCAILVIRQGGARAKQINDCIESISQSGAEMLGCIFNNAYPLEFMSASGTEGYYDGGYGESKENSHRQSTGFSYRESAGKEADDR